MEDNHFRRKGKFTIPVAALAFFLSGAGFVSATEKVPIDFVDEVPLELGNELPLWSVLPFVGMLLSIAIFPLIKPHWWERHLLKVAIFWSVVFLVPFAISFGPSEALSELLEIVILDYLPFIVLLWGLFAVSGGIVLKGELAGTPKVNIALIVIGTLLASWVGTTGASMLLIRPVIRANRWREKKAHVVIFFIFLVSNIGGCLTPVGDPPLFLGFLRNVPFFWTMRLAPMLLMNSAILLVLLFLIDRRLYNKEIAAGRKPEVSIDRKPLRVEGLHNLVFLAVIVGSVILSGMLSENPLFYDAAAEQARGIPVYGHVVVPFSSMLQMALIILAGLLSVATTKKALREANLFTWGPIKEVASLFIGIFITMIPALAILNARGAELGLEKPWHFFWATGTLSSFLDNAPTYLVFMTTAGSLGSVGGVSTAVGTIAPALLMAISAGAVFMGANTYIGNAPNFMVKSIAEENGIKMPSFFGYMKWSVGILIPLFLLDTLVFFPWW
ncbi:MAG: sodium:proton antiporter [Clostridiales Family XIII bacterium]|jgi:Na+/H+ antiporter NhaD/arsenite permease-like protein|nr:sodium:proton antiporter [Clostridiales Family XIII bacterium]